MPSRRRLQLEVEATAELQGSGGSKGGDVTEGPASNDCVGGVGAGSELRVIQQIERLDANLKLALTFDVEPAEDACVDVGDSRAAELVSVRVAEVRRQDCSGGLASSVRRLNRIGEG
jgi:hypothetical protein